MPLLPEICQFSTPAFYSKRDFVGTTHIVEHKQHILEHKQHIRVILVFYSNMDKCSRCFVKNSINNKFGKISSHKMEEKKYKLYIKDI